MKRLFLVVVLLLLGLCSSFRSILSRSKPRQSVQMTYGYAWPAILFGWAEPNGECVIDQGWLEERGLLGAADELNKGESRLAVYGIVCELGSDTGQAILEPSDREKVEKAYNFIIKYYKQENIEIPPLAFQSVIAYSDLITWWDQGSRFPRNVYFPELIDSEEAPVESNEIAAPTEVEEVMKGECQGSE